MRLIRIAAALLLPLCLGAQVPAPAEYFGHELTADRQLLDWEKVVSYFRELDAASPLIKVEELGTTTEGRPFIAAIISGGRTMQNLQGHIEIQRKLADPRLTPEAHVDALVNDGKAVVMITCSIHSTEVASTHSAVLFAHKLVSSAETAATRQILDNVIFILVPSLNPDGVDIVTNWYRNTLETPFEGTSPPELYHKYVGHDNNRDWYIFSQAETRLAISKLHNVWRPQVVYDVHQQSAYGARLFVPPWLDPVEPNVDPLLVQSMNHFGTGIAMDLTAAGKKGVVVNAIYDFWTPARAYQAFHGGMRILTESASARLATPVTIQPDQLTERALGYSPREASWNHPDPWQGGEWRLRDIVEYQMLAFESCLRQAAMRRESLLRNFYRVQKNQVERQEPYSFVIPAQQRDPGATKRLIDTLVFGMVEVEIESDGSRRVRMQQPYSGFAKALLERQRYPDLREYPGGPPRRPYDVTAHTLPLLMGVDVEVRRRPSGVGAIRPATTPPAGRLSASDTDTWPAINRLWSERRQVWRDPKTGDFAPEQVSADWKEVKRPRVGLYKSYVPAMDEGWTRWILERMGFAYESVRNSDVVSGNLHERFDVILFPDQPPSTIAGGYKRGTMPDEYTGGLGETGAAALKAFARDGGTLVFLNRSTAWAVEALELPARDTLREKSNREFYAPGSLLNVKLDASHPLAHGLPETIPVWMEHSPAWDIEEGAVARYGDRNLLASGWLLGENHLFGRAALADIRQGEGRVILFGMRPQYRAQSYLTMKLLFNALVL
ncbi:MAG: peptidase M14 [Bryobacterales bacterium]|nr:peptidase M14 [Bryobacterales bacterium]